MAFKIIRPQKDYTVLCEQEADFGAVKTLVSICTEIQFVRPLNVRNYRKFRKLISEGYVPHGEFSCAKHHQSIINSCLLARACVCYTIRNLDLFYVPFVNFGRWSEQFFEQV